MKIEILRWGSLIWNPKTLQYNKEIGWQKDGPFLPLEFARISMDGRLTLVITPEGKEVQTLYTFSTYNTIDEAILNLAVREGSGRKSIGYYDKNRDLIYPANFEYLENLKSWLAINPDIEAVIWTNLGANWEETDRLKSNNQNRIEHLQALDGPAAALAEEYIRKAPIQITTTFRKEIEKELNWLQIK